MSNREIYSYSDSSRRGEDRNIYSNSGRGSGRGPKKKHTGRHIAIVLSCLFVLVAVGAVVYATTLLSRINRQDVNTDSWKEQPSAAPAWSVASDKDIINIMLLGADQNENGSNGRSDTMMLMSIDKKNGKVRLVSFLRDLYVQIPTLGMNRLNASFSKGGAGLTLQTIENNFRIDLQKYVMVNFNSFSKIIDKLGGLDIEMTKAEANEMNKNMGCKLKAGVNHINGDLCLYFARIRAIDSDFGRTSRQRQVIETMLKKMKSMGAVNFSTVLYDFLPYVTTNMSDGDLLYLASVAKQVSEYPVETMSIPAQGMYKDKTIDGMQVLVPDLKKNCEVLHTFIFGESPDGSSSSKK